ncbi:MAG: sigma 54-interacting transcriptional regulator [Gemmataceae bacterium]
MPGQHTVPAPEFESLTDLLLRMSQERTAQGVMDTLTGRIIATRPHQARVCVWLLDRDVLRLAASARQPGGEAFGEWPRPGGDYRTVPLDDPLVGPAVANRSITVARVEADWPAYPEWARAEGIIGYGAAPVLHRDELFGVFGVFLRYRFPDDGSWQQGVAWTRVLGQYLGAMIANARAFEEIDRLRARLELENAYLRERDAADRGYGDIVGRSPALAHAVDQASLVASTDAGVLILGESGTGKELFAKLIHDRSPRAKGPLIRVNCAAVPHDLFESEFFGHVKGSFTGAVRDRVGRFQLADGGTLFLDEVGEIPLDLQGKLLRVLQEGTFERVGEERTQRVNVRVVAATNRDLRAEVAAKRFREDLFYRLGVFPVHLPPLRDRRDDIPLLAEHFLRYYATRLGRPVPVLRKRHAAELQAYPWPGNVRELQHVVERAVIISVAGQLRFHLGEGEADAAEPPAPTVAASAGSADDVMTYAEFEQQERANLLRALQRTNWKVSGRGGAAELLGINPSTLATKIKTLQITRPR